MPDTREENRIASELTRTGASPDPFAAAVRATRMPMLITDPHQADNPIVFVNDAFSKLTGYARDEILGRNCRFLQGPDTDRDDVARIRDAVERRVSIEVDLINYKKNGETFWNRLLVSPVFDDDGQLTYFFASQFDVTLERERLVRVQRDRDALEREIERRSTALRRSEERLHFILKASRLGSWTLDLADMRLVASDSCKRNVGREPGDPFSFDDLVAAILPEDRDRMQAAIRASIESRSDYDIEYRIRTPSGEVRWLQIRGQPFYDADGAPLSMAGVTLDVTERKRGDEHRALLAEELNHRVKNSLATIQSIANQTLTHATSLDEARKAFNARLQSLAAAHDVLTRESWDGATLAEIVEEALRPFRTGAGVRFKTGGPPVRLPPRLALAFVMALHELATNAVKYGALSTPQGRVILNWDIVDGSQPGRLWLRWEEIGGPPVAEPARRGFGSRMIERVLAAELGGTAQVEYRSRGVVATVEAPLPEAGAPSSKSTCTPPAKPSF
ncbi:PAS domain-containing protein [Methylobacterium platani]|uniref:Blue-light-activated histidine kinase n=2 Tax=Methylobacterium platani TaxID=427683 RepID=A0A179SJ13_9HYPH|nr:PAS domain-containing protein [Methylobacterium platani]KMO18757.1 histidine kinase [Methylobacterium platani JCM 14648]OAS27766.1 histidine kinase [Methylobacterium platani]